MKTISVRGARTHNLKNIDVDIPRDQLIVITGLSGSGKSSLAFDTLYAEGQRRYVESLSAYARQFLSLMEKPDVDHIEGLSPTISIEQKSASRNPRSTVGTITEIYDYLRLLFARVGTPHCPTHQTPLSAKTISEMVDCLLALPEHTKLMILSPVIQDRKGEHLKLLDQLRAQGYVRARIDGTLYELEETPHLDPKRKHTIDVVIDRLMIRPDLESRLSESLETALRLSEHLVYVDVLNDAGSITEQIVFSSQFACITCGYSLPELEPRCFSFNNPAGACPTCDGLGIKHFMDPDKIKRHPEYSRTPDVIPTLERRLRETTSKYVREELSRYLSPKTCPDCEGSRLNPAARAVWVAGRTLPNLTALTIADARQFFQTLDLSGAKGDIAGKILKEICSRLTFLVNVGLDYLSLHRSADTLSGGETQRIRLASQIGAGLVGILYVLDEPSIGLHQRDNDRLLQTLTHLKDLGNTVIMVEHDEDAILSADYVIDIGPGAGVHGGTVVAVGTPQAIMQNPLSLTGQYLAHSQNIAIPRCRRPADPKRQLTLTGASGNNLKQIQVSFPVGLITAVTGVSGSGKSTLVNDTLYPLAAQSLNGVRSATIKPYLSIQGLEQFDKVIDIDQSPIGRTPRSNAATYTGLFGDIRELFTQTPDARSRGYKVGRFSFNVKGGRCEACQGDGLVKVEMHFLPDVYVACDVCRKKRYNRETLAVQYKGKNIHEVLTMTVEEALPFFKAIPSLARKLETLHDVGLSYLQIGQSATTLSGGEAQRIKLAKELSRRDTGKTLYLLDEPTTGLHFHDVKQLLKILAQLADRGNTVIIIEHNLDVIKTADWIIDLGPEGGDAGGTVVAVGTPETVANVEASYTGQFLQPLLNR